MKCIVTLAKTSYGATNSISATYIWCHILSYIWWYTEKNFDTPAPKIDTPAPFLGITLPQFGLKVPIIGSLAPIFSSKCHVTGVPWTPKTRFKYTKGA